MMKSLAKAFTIIGGLLALFMTVGFLLPGTWSAEATLEVPAEPEAVFPFLDDLGRWDEWTQWAEIASTISDPPSGSGATRNWEDAQYGSGSVTIVESRPSELVRYQVSVGESAGVTGTLRLSASPNGSVVTWIEEGDFGRNPLMGYVARSMTESQGQQLTESLERLKNVVGQAHPAVEQAR
jgi:hypothetical protein